MMTQPSGATGPTAAGAAVLVGTPAEGNEGAGAGLQCAPGGANPALFSQALLALAAGMDPAGDLLAAAGAAAAAPAAAAAGAPSQVTAQRTAVSVAPLVTAPADGADALPRDLLLALFTAADATPEAGGALRKNGQAETTKTDQPAAVQAAPADPGAALLAAVLQWLQQQHPGARDASTATVTRDSKRETAIDGTDTNSVAAATAAPITNSPAAMVGAGRADGASAAGAAATSLAATSGATLSSELASQRDGDGRAASGDQPRTPAIVADSVAGTGTGAGPAMDMAAALRAASAASSVQVERSVTVPVHERHWPTALAAQVLVLSNDKVQAATLRLSPEHLGPVEVHIDMQETNVNVNFTAAHAETRAALEQAMPQLRAVLAGAGLSLGQATVQQQARRESQNSNALPRVTGTADEPIEAPTALTRALGMIDEYV